MSRVKLLLDVTTDLCNLAKSVSALANAIDGKEAPDAEQEVSPVNLPDPAAPTISLERVRAVLADVSRTGKIAEVKGLLERFGADRLSAIDPARYPELLHAAEAL